MIQKETIVNVADNSGAKVARVFFVYKPLIKTRGLAYKVLVSLRKVVPNNAKKLKKGDKFKALIIMQKNPVNKNYSIKSQNNVVILLKKGDDTLPLGTRIYCKVSKFTRYIGYSRLFLLSRGVI